MKDFLKSNLFYAIVSVVMAVFLMLYVDSLSIPATAEKTFSNLTVQAMNLPEGMLIDNELPRVDLRLKGYSTTLAATSAKDIRVWVDLKGTQAGAGTYPLQTSLPSGLETVWSRPASLNLTLDTLGEKTLTVLAQVQNSVAQGYSSQAPRLNPETVTLKGPQSLLDRVASAAVNVDLNGLTDDCSRELPVSLWDSQGQRVEDERLELNNPTVWAGIKVSENKASKTVAVRPAFSGRPEEKYRPGGVEVTPDKVRIAGTYELIRDIEYLNTEPLDLTGATEDYTVRAALVIPEGIEVLEGSEVSVTVKIEENLVHWVVREVPVQVVNAPAGSVYVTIPAALDVTLATWPWIIGGAGGEGQAPEVPLRLYVDLQGENPGDRLLPVLTEVPEDYRVVQLSAESVRVVT